MAASPGEKAEAMEAKGMPCAKEQQQKMIKYRGWKAMPYVIGNETFEKLGAVGTASNLLVYLTTVFHMSTVSAATAMNVLNGTTNLAPILGAFVSDTYLGRYLTLAFGSIASLLGMVIITLTAAIRTLHPPPCALGQTCVGITPGQMVVLLTGFAFLVVGAGGIRPTNLAFGADQFNPNTTSGRRGINSFFNWYYFTFTFAVLISSTIIIYIQTDISWTLGLAIPAVLMFASCVLFFLGTKIYVKVRPEGSPFTSIVQVLVAAPRKRKVSLPAEDLELSLFDPPHTSSLNSKLPYTDQFKFLDKAAVLTPADELQPDGSAKNPWKLCSMQQVEEVKCILRVIPIWLTGIIYYIPGVQLSTYVVFQALQSDRHFTSGGFQIPAGSFNIFSMIALTIWLPIYDRLVVPWLRRMTGHEGGITLLQRMGVGIVLTTVAMIVAALVEVRRRSFALDNGGGIAPMSSLWLIPQIALSGLADAFHSVGQNEFYYKQFPENMRSIAGALSFLNLALSNYLSSFMVTVVHATTGGDHGKKNWLAEDLNKGRLEYYYLLNAVISVLNFVVYVMCARWYRYKGSESSKEVELERKKTINPDI